MSSKNNMSSKDAMKIIDFLESTKDIPDIAKFDELLKLNVEMYANSIFDQDITRKEQFVRLYSQPNSESNKVSLLNFKSQGKENPSIYIDEKHSKKR